MIRLMVIAVGCLVGIDDGPRLPSVSYDEMKAKTGRDADAQVRLALWCEAHGLERERLKHLAVAVMTDPSHAMARGLMGLVEYRGKWRRPEAVAEAMKGDTAAADLLAEYNGRRVRTPVKADPQWKLAQWCREKGLIAESRAHLATVIRLDPNHADAWKALGYRKVGQRWITEDQAAAEKAEHAAQAKADKDWHHRLERIKGDLLVTPRRAAAERALAEVNDPRAVPSVWKSFVTKTDQKGNLNHLQAVQLLGQIDAAGASRALATLAVLDQSAEVRRRAIETLRRRDAREYADLLIGMLRSRIRYEVKPVAGPGSQGVLYVEGKQANFKRLYTPDGLPQVRPGDQFGYDNQGRLVAVRHGAIQTSGRIQIDQMDPALLQSAYEFSVANPTSSLNPLSFQNLPWNGQQPFPFATTARPSPSRNSASTRANVESVLHSRGADNPALVGLLTDPFNAPPSRVDPFNRLNPAPNIQYATGDLRPKSGLIFDYDPTVTIPVEQMTVDAYRSAKIAQDRLTRDVASLDEINTEISRGNERALAVLAATGESFGDDRKAWEEWYVNQVGYAFMTPDDSKPTVIEDVPLNYQPSAVPTPGIEILSITRMSCFGKGTAVHTISGNRPIEELNVGDKVLTQDTKTGKLGYRPVLVVHRNPPSPTFRVDLDGQPVVASHFHRFWVAGRGWVMAHDLKVGDPIRTLGGTSKVTAIEADKVQPVFNLDVADDADFFAGSVAALVHDNTLPDLRQAPFDAPPAVAAVR